MREVLGDACPLPAASAKAAAALLSNCEAFFQRVPITHAAFITLTFTGQDAAADSARVAQAALSRFIRLLRKARPSPLAWLAVLERSDRGRLHYHIVLDAGCDIRGDFNFDAEVRSRHTPRGTPAHFAATRAYGRSATPGLRSLWHHVSRAATQAGFGRPHTVPVRTCGEAVAKYIAKYIGKHQGRRLLRDARAKAFRCSPCVRRSTQGFAWNSPRSRAWRQATGEILKDLFGLRSLASPGGLEPADFAGRNWAWILGDAIHRRAESILADSVQPAA